MSFANDDQRIQISKSVHRLEANRHDLTAGNINDNHLIMGDTSDNATEIKRLSSFNTNSDMNLGGHSGFIDHSRVMQNRRFSKYSETGTIIEEADPEQFGNDLVMQLEHDVYNIFNLYSIELRT